MAEFGDKYDGDVQAALRGLQKERLTVDVAPLDRNEMKRKWAPVPEEEEHETRLGDSGKNTNNGHSRAAKHREWLYLPPLTPIRQFLLQKVRVAPPSPKKKPPPFPGNNAPSRIQAPRTPGTVRRLLFIYRLCQLSQTSRQKVSHHRAITESEQTRAHALSASLPHRRVIAHQTYGGLPRPPSQQHPRSLDVDIQACDPTTSKDTHLSPTTALAAERREHAQH